MKAAEIFNVRGLSVVITGGGTGLGRAIAGTMVENGANVLIAGRTESDLHDACEALSGFDGAIETCICDVTIEADVKALFDRCESLFAVPDAVISSAGIASRKPALDMSAEEWRNLMAVNLDGAFLVAREAARRMIAAGIGGSIMHMGSVLEERPMKNLAAYSTSKAALGHLTRSLALEWARHSIRVNTIAPGWFPTELNAEFLGENARRFLCTQNPSGRLGQNGDLAGVALLLASSAGAYITGATIPVDGGHAL